MTAVQLLLRCGPCGASVLLKAKVFGRKKAETHCLRVQRSWTEGDRVASRSAFRNPNNKKGVFVSVAGAAVTGTAVHQELR